MAIDNRLDSSTHIIDTYLAAQAAWDKAGTGEPDQALTDALKVLCEGIGAVANDAQFWAAVTDMPRLYGENRAAVDQRLADLDGFLAEEEQILSPQIGRPRAVRLLSDVRNAIDLARETPNGPAIVNLQNRVGDLAKQTCDASKEVSAAGTRSPGRFYQLVKIVKKGIMVAAGGTFIVADWTLAPTVLLGIPSVIEGIKIIDAQFPRD